MTDATRMFILISTGSRTGDIVAYYFSFNWTPWESGYRI